MKLSVLALMLLGMSAGAQAAERDWTVEQPLVAGFLTGVSLGACWTCWHGHQAVPASEHDPFGVSPWVQDVLYEMGRRPYWIGVSAGVSLTSLLIGGVFVRRLNTLSARATRNAHGTGLEMAGAC